MIGNVSEKFDVALLVFFNFHVSTCIHFSSCLSPRAFLSPVYCLPSSQSGHIWRKRQLFQWCTGSGGAAYDTTVLQPPPPQNPPIPTNKFVQFYTGGMNGLSRRQSGAFFGFSVEMSVARHVRTYFLMLGIFFDI
jgi:hypothetical protein